MFSRIEWNEGTARKQTWGGQWPSKDGRWVLARLHLGSDAIGRMHAHFIDALVEQILVH